MVRGISLGNGFWVVREQQKRSTLNFAHTFPTDCCTKPLYRFSNNELFVFYSNNSTSFKSA